MGYVYSCFTQQIFLADVCARHTSDLEPDQVKIREERFARQLAAFATQEGGYSKGAFSEIAIGWLEGQNEWPEIDTIIDTLVSEFAKSKVKPFTFYASDNARELEERFGDEPNSSVRKRRIEILDQNSTKGFISFTVAKGMTFQDVAEFLGRHVRKDVRLEGFSESERFAPLKELQLTCKNIREALDELGALALGVAIRDYEVLEKGQQFIHRPVSS
jgi:hypothetical protein